ncbi:2Fe-2S iron-sulfur cluster-binding protein [Yoonia sp.]|jgi:aerobic-type carbon monoxide dehydrogenase small subunit (CoxS/CutS family)|uniref:2Fe-2S iron-sulfur cluster-binding protein n=1 Tax=Yoonia sp. TaxID=2212373 RepID=UPI004048875B|nr:2Fe-2S iron-sulfur cluster-binding protein [Verrucomicrobiota bacterium]
MIGTIFWQGRPVPFQPGESVASALNRAGIRAFGLFCGIGQCQGCLVAIEGRTFEACLMRCRDGVEIDTAGVTDA